MKTIWSVISFLAIVHLLAIAMFAVWLWKSDRLSPERIEAARTLFGPTVTQAAAAAEAETREVLEQEQRMLPISLSRSSSLMLKFSS